VTTAEQAGVNPAWGGVKHLSWAELEAGLESIRQSPQDRGALEMIVVRPGTDQRLVLDACELGPGQGVHGDDWASRAHVQLPDGAVDLKAQVTLMNARAIALLAQSKDRWALAGDQLIVDLDLSGDNLQPGQRLRLGTAVLELTDKPHRGCAKFAERFGAEALKFVNSEAGRKLHLRGIYAMAVQPGKAQVGDLVVKC
jgi:MOSC domain-containing protein YiiM